MTAPLRIVRHPLGPRLYVAGRRVHHGSVCAVACAAALLGAWHDRRDFREWFRGEMLP